MKRLLLIVFPFILLTLSAEYIEEGFELMKNKAKTGDAYYQGVLGEIYYRGERGEMDIDKAIYWSKLSSEKENPIGFFNLGVMCVLGEYIPEDNQTCIELFENSLPGLKKLSEENNPRAQTALSSIYRNGFGAEKDIGKSLRLNRKAAEQGFPRAMYVEGIIHYNGIGTKKDYSEAKEWFKKLSEAGDEKARFQIANMYYNGHGYEKNIEKALNIYREIQGPNLLYKNRVKEGDYIIQNLLPPKYSLIIEEGSCGECCLWSVIRAKGMNATQIEINKKGGAPGRGLHSDELYYVMHNYNVNYIDLSRSVNALDSTQVVKRYRGFLYKDIINEVKKGKPVLIGVKIYPNNHPEWPCDHFVLIVGYNEITNELIYNDFTRRKRINAEQLISQAENGYSFINNYNWVFAIIFTDFTDDN